MGNKNSSSIHKEKTNDGKLISISILHRHGARGPGKSELSPFNDENIIKTQWKTDEFEVITSAGHQHIKNLGAWYARRCEQLSHDSAASINPTYFWRCSKSDRAIESGEDFTSAFNALKSTQVFSQKSVPYDVDADCYFRSWNIYKDESHIPKEECKMIQNDWYEKLKKNKDFLTKIFKEVNASKKVFTPSTIALWSTTYLMALRECEEFWDECEGSQRDALSKILTNAEDWMHIESLAIWVWEQRFFNNGFEKKLGGKITQELLQRTLYNESSVNVFSGHDYTILAVLSNFINGYKLKGSTSFGSYIILELWDGEPPLHPGLLSCCRKKESYSKGEQFIRVIINTCPFKNDANHVVSEVQDSKEEIVIELSIAEAEAIIKDIDDYFLLLE
jgi:hypothetical protein